MKLKIVKRFEFLVDNRQVAGPSPAFGSTALRVQTGHIGDTLYRLHG